MGEASRVANTGEHRNFGRGQGWRASVLRTGGADFGSSARANTRTRCHGRGVAPAVTKLEFKNSGHRPLAGVAPICAS